MPQKGHPEPGRRGAQSHPYAHFVGSLGNRIGNDAIDADDGEQQRERGKAEDRCPIKMWPGKGVSHPLVHGFYAEHWNLPVYRLDRVADHGEAVFGAAIDPNHEGREKAPPAN